jgi:hypothetical protein
MKAVLMLLRNFRLTMVETQVHRVPKSRTVNCQTVEENLVLLLVQGNGTAYVVIKQISSSFAQLI